MGIWVVVLEAVAGDDRNTIEPEDLDALAAELADCYPQVSGGPAFYEAEFWIEDATAGGAVMNALRIWQAAVRELGMPTWDVVRAEARDARAIEAGLIEWAPFDEDEPDDEFDEAVVHEAVVDEAVDDEFDELVDDEVIEDEPEQEVPAAPPGPARSLGGRPRPARGAPVETAAARKPTAKKVAAGRPAAKKVAAKKVAAKKTRSAGAPPMKKAATKLAPLGAAARAKKQGGRIAKGR